MIPAAFLIGNGKVENEFGVFILLALDTDAAAVGGHDIVADA